MRQGSREFRCPVKRRAVRRHDPYIEQSLLRVRPNQRLQMFPAAESTSTIPYKADPAVSGTATIHICTAGLAFRAMSDGQIGSLGRDLLGRIRGRRQALFAPNVRPLKARFQSYAAPWVAGFVR